MIFFATRLSCELHVSIRNKKFTFSPALNTYLNNRSRMKWNVFRPLLLSAMHFLMDRRFQEFLSFQIQLTQFTFFNQYLISLLFLFTILNVYCLISQYCMLRTTLQIHLPFSYIFNYSFHIFFLLNRIHIW